MANLEEILQQLKTPASVSTTQSGAWNVTATVPNRVSVEHAYSNARLLAVAATFSAIKTSAGFLHTVNIGSSSCPTLTIYDNASGASGTILAQIEPAQSGSYIYDVSFTNGATAFFEAGNTPSANVSFR